MNYYKNVNFYYYNNYYTHEINNRLNCVPNITLFIVRPNINGFQTFKHLDNFAV